MLGSDAGIRAGRQAEDSTWFLEYTFVRSVMLEDAVNAFQMLYLYLSHININNSTQYKQAYIEYIIVYI